MRRITTTIAGALILFIGAGIILGLIFRAREADRKTRCASNLQSVGLGVINYSDQIGCLPLAAFPSLVEPPERRMSLLYAISPYLDNRNWTPGVRQDQPWDAEENLRCGNVRINCFLCPASTNEQLDGLFLTHYVGIAGIGENAASLPKENRNAGFFGYDRKITMADVKDGLGTTLMLVETGHQNGPWFAGGYPTVRGLASTDHRPYLGKEAQFGGLHRSGTAALFADWSYRFLNDSIDPTVFEAMATIARGDKVPDFQFDD